jgi:hypothetical protein
VRHIDFVLFAAAVLQAKNAALAAAGAIVPDSFEGLEGVIKQTYDR